MKWVFKKSENKPFLVIKSKSIAYIIFLWFLFYFKNPQIYAENLLKILFQLQLIFKVEIMILKKYNITIPLAV